MQSVLDFVESKDETRGSRRRPNGGRQHRSAVVAERRDPATVVAASRARRRGSDEALRRGRAASTSRKTPTPVWRAWARGNSGIPGLLNREQDQGSLSRLLQQRPGAQHKATVAIFRHFESYFGVVELGA